MSRAMFRTPFFSLLVLLLSICNVAVAQADALAPRQSPGPSAAALASPLCQSYATTANISTVALNSTLRAAYIRSAPVGTFTSINILDAEEPKITALMMDVQLNQQCGNLTAVALAGADANLTAGTVLGLPILEAPGIDVGDIAMPLVSITIFLVMGGTWLSL
ncbi:hypothetical protein GGR53DRAFT_480259 [Hypoxylon sp. FL1150]|nr:hypothetical protein GGR53DRAFT_480259 [Hypoxylon sp. FL1150]